MTYDRRKQQEIATAYGAGERRKAAQAAGLERYLAVPFCGGGFTDHYRSAHTGLCLSCRALTRARKRITAEPGARDLSPEEAASRAAKRVAKRAAKKAATSGERAAKHEELMRAAAERRAALFAATGQTPKQAKKQRRRQLVAARKRLQQLEINKILNRHE